MGKSPHTMRAPSLSLPSPTRPAPSYARDSSFKFEGSGFPPHPRGLDRPPPSSFPPPGSPSKPVALAYRRHPRHVGPTPCEEGRAGRWTSSAALIRVVAAAAAVAALRIVVGRAADASAAASSAEDAVEAMAREVVRLSREVEGVNRRSELLEEEERAVREELERERDEIAELRREEEEDKRELLKREEEIQELIAQVRVSGEAEDAKVEGEKKKKLRGDADGAADGVERALAELKEKMARVQEAIQAQDRGVVETLFGPGPHRVRIELEFPPESSPEDDEADGGEDEGGDGDGGAGEDEDEDGGTLGDRLDSFIVEMAPLDLMPHSVRLFLEQVGGGLWDGCAFYRNARHIVQAEPATVEGDPSPARRFAEADMESVSFQEYSDRFPHMQYTVGFAGRPGGPKWYVNKVDNTKWHGPGGQAKFNGSKEAEPCFGRVVSGFDAVNRLGRMPIDNEKPKEHMLRYVRIVSATII